jgi:drug/metabolite transporter (DMT)-like permease
MQGFIYIGVAVSLWAVGSGIIAKGFSVPALAWYPVAALIGTVFILVWLYKQGKLRELWPASVPARCFLLAGGVAMALNNGLFFSSLQHTSVAVALLTHYLTPLLVAVLFAPLFLRERLTMRDLFITLVGLVGLVVVLWPELSNSTLGLGSVLGAASALFYAAGVIITRKLSNYSISGLAGVVYQNFVPVVLMSPFFFTSFTANAFVSGDWVRAAIFGVLCLGVGFGLFFVGLQKVEKAAYASVLSYGEPIGAIILASIFMGEPMTMFIIVGGILIIGAGIALVWSESRTA